MSSESRHRRVTWFLVVAAVLLVAVGAYWVLVATVPNGCVGLPPRGVGLRGEGGGMLSYGYFPAGSTCTWSTREGGTVTTEYYPVGVNRVIDAAFLGATCLTALLVARRSLERAAPSPR